MKYFKDDKYYATEGNVLNNLLSWGKTIDNRKLTPEEARDFQNLLYLLPEKFEEVMGIAPRTKEVADLLSKLSRTIGDDKYKKARGILNKLKKILGDNDPEVIRVSTFLKLMEDE